MRVYEKTLEKERRSASEYSLLIKNLGIKVTKQDIASHFKNLGSKVVEVSFVHYVAQKIIYSEKIISIEKDLYIKKIKYENIKNRESPYNLSISEEIKSLTHAHHHFSALKAINDDTSLDGGDFMGIAFVTFNTIKDKKVIENKYRESCLDFIGGWLYFLCIDWIIELCGKSPKLNSKVLCF